MFPRFIQSLRHGIKRASTIFEKSKRTSSTSSHTSPQKTLLPKKYWISYGFNNEHELLDRHIMHQAFFVAVTVCTVGTGFALVYAPDPAMKDWARREAFIQMRYKEEHGLPYVDRDLIDPKKIILPTDEELGSTQIIL